MNLVETRFENVPLEDNLAPDFADIVYKIFRCNDAHGSEIPSTYSVTKSQGNFGSDWYLADGHLHMPDRVIFALLGVAVFSRANANIHTNTDHVLTLGRDEFRIADWWGREDAFRRIAARYNQTRLKFQGLKLPPKGSIPDNVAHVVVKQPYP